MKNLKLNQIEKEIKSKNEMNQLRGGNANDARGTHSLGMKLVYINIMNEDDS